MKRITLLVATLSLAACQNPTAPTSDLTPVRFANGGSTSPADKGSCGPRDELNNGELKHCAPGKAPGNSNDPSK